MILEPWPYPFWIAHRGAGRLAPENTLAAFRLGASFGYRAFECDVKLSRDGQPFLLHDATLERTTNGRGTAGHRTLAELQRLDAGGWHSAVYAGEPIPSLDAIARFALEGDFALNLELKPTPGQEAETGHVVAHRVAGLWAGQPAVVPLLSSFQPAALEAARDAAPALPRALLLDALPEGWLDTARGLGCVAVVASWKQVDAGVVRRLHDAGLRALCYTVNEPREAERLVALGIDGLITDAVDRFAPERAS